MNHWISYRSAEAVIIAILILSGCAHYQPDPWTKEDTAYHAALTTLMIVDWRQTKHIAKSDDFYELQPMLGKYPGQNEVDLYFAASWIGKTAVAYVLPEDYRRYWQMGFIGMSAGCVGWNYSVGVRMEF